MTLSPGTKLGRYEIRSKLGEGGMGEVYRATDITLNRDVAIKVLPGAFVNDPERLARFQREAQVLASLTHTNIATIFGVEEQDGFRGLVMELVEGPTLADRIATGPLPLDEALPIARQIAEALEVAHERNIIHRDLKPANVKISTDGVVKVLDFGLAKVFTEHAPEADLSNSPTLMKATQAGVILGTAAYMSPEQARGKVVDKRADIWAFGCVLSEMLTGRQTFIGETLTDTLAAVVRAEPDWSKLPATTPRSIRNLLERCLTKDPKQRLRDIGEARIILENPHDPIEVATPTVSRTAHGRRALLIAAIALAFFVGGISVWLLRPGGSETPLRKLELQIPNLNTESSTGYSISPDGKMVAYVSTNQLWIRDLDRLEPRKIANTENAAHPFWSPDSKQLGYITARRMWKVASDGSGTTLITDLPDVFSGAGSAAWKADGNIIFTNGFTGLRQVADKGGDWSVLLDPGQDEVDFHDVSVLPDNRGVLFAVHHTIRGVDTIAVFDGKTRKTVFKIEGQRVSNPEYSPSGHILFTRQLSNAGIWALPFSLKTLEPTGDPFLIVSGPTVAKVSNDGTLVFTNAREHRETRLVLKNRKGETVRQIQQETLNFQTPSVRLSPDGKRVVLATRETGKTDYWVIDMDRGTRTRLTTDNVSWSWFCAWTPDNQNILYGSGDAPIARQVFLKAADGSGEAKELVKAAQVEFSPDRKFFIYTNVRGQGTWDLWYTSTEPEAKHQPYLVTGRDESDPEFSPDGRFVAYQSNETDQTEIYIKPFPPGEGKWRVSTGGGSLPRWSPKGNELFFASGQDLMVVSVQTKPTVVLGNPQKLFTRPRIWVDRAEGVLDGFDVAPDGQHFVMLESPESPNTVQVLNVVQNWFAEFRRK